MNRTRALEYDDHDERLSVNWGISTTIIIVHPVHLILSFPVVRSLVHSHLRGEWVERETVVEAPQVLSELRWTICVLKCGRLTLIYHCYDVSLVSSSVDSLTLVLIHPPTDFLTLDYLRIPLDASRYSKLFLRLCTNQSFHTPTPTATHSADYNCSSEKRNLNPR